MVAWARMQILRSLTGGARASAVAGDNASGTILALHRGVAFPSLVYRPRRPEREVLHTIVPRSLREVPRAGGRATYGQGLPPFVERAFEDFLTCGCLAAGFARFRCAACRHERLVAFSCKGRGFCPSCGGRLMTARAEHLIDYVFQDVPVRQPRWTLQIWPLIDSSKTGH